jgi:PLAC8 family
MTVKTCTIVAPSTLEEGYTFSANVDGIDFTVTVPKGGVTEGQQFEVPYPTETIYPTAVTVSGGEAPATQNPNPAITGRWRNDLCTCFEVCGSGMFWQGWCCFPLLVGQVMQRRKLNACGSPVTSPDSYKNTFYIVAAVWVLFIVVWGATTPGSFVNNFVYLAFWIYMAIILTQTRFFYRKLYKIPADTCGCCDGRMEDFCCGYWCGCCTAIQMARHSHDHNKYPYSCCATTGLNMDAPEIV